MNKFIKILSLTISLACLLIAAYSCQHDDVVVQIEDLTVEKTFDIPLKPQKGWVTRSITVTHNTADDSIRLGPTTIIAPQWTGLLYMNDEYNAEPSTFHYQPYKATKGSVTIRWRVSN